MTRKARMLDGDHIDFDVFGDRGPFVFLGPQLYLNPQMPHTQPVVDAYVASLRDRYRVILADWPRGVGASSPARGPTMTCQGVVDDILCIADAAGAHSFAWWGYSFGGAAGLQLAACSDRVSALVCGGYPPLWQPVSDMLNVVRRMAAQMEDLSHLANDLPAIDPEIHRQNIAFYESVAAKDELALLEQIHCPRLVFHDVDDTVELGGLKHDFAARTRAAQAELEARGWQIAWVDTGRAHFAMEAVDACTAAFGPFLDRVLLGADLD